MDYLFSKQGRLWYNDMEYGLRRLYFGPPGPKLRDAVRGAGKKGGVPMKNRVVVTIAGQEYTMVAVEDEEYVRKCAAYVDEQIRGIGSTRLSQADTAVLAAMNLADQYFREKADADDLRTHYKDSLEEASQLKLELAEAKREIFSLQTRK